MGTCTFANVDTDRCLLCYKYINHGVTRTYKEAILWVDTAFNNVKFHCVDRVTPWHGSWSSQQDQVVIRFDSKYGHGHDVPTLRSVNLFLSAEKEVLNGFDYRRRFVEIIPIYMWTFVPPLPNQYDTIGGWRLHAKWQRAQLDVVGQWRLL